MSASIFTGQTAIELIFNTSTSLGDAKDIVLHATSPSGIKKTFTPTVLDAINGIVKYDVEETTDFDEAGMWTFYISVTYNNNTINRSEPAKIMFNEAVS